MLKTCTRCRSRRIRCDARLPACHNCHRSSLSCSFYDDVLQEDIPRSYIKSLYDRIDELKALVSVHQASSSGVNDSSGPEKNGISDPDAFQCTIPFKNGYRFLESSPPVIIGNVTIRKLQKHGVKIESPFLTSNRSGQDQDGLQLHAACKFDRCTISPNTVRLLLSHYTRCIEPVYPTGINFADEADASLKQMDEEDRCQVLLACAVSAVHKSYHAPSWKVVATSCREWAGELAPSLVLRRNDQTVVILLLLIIYELADPDRGLIRDMLSFATRMCLELGWHRAHEQTNSTTPDPVSPGIDRKRLSPDSKDKILRVLINIERPLSILTHRPSILSSSMPSTQFSSDLAYDSILQLIEDLFNSGTTSRSTADVQCPITERHPRALMILQTMPASEVSTHEAWLLLHPVLTDHEFCSKCSSFPTVAHSVEFLSIHARVLSEASCLVDSVHAMLTSQDAFLPPMIGGSRTFMAGCVLVTGLSSKWDGADKHIGALLKCSEILAFTAPLWKGGKDYYDVYRQIARSI